MALLQSLADRSHTVILITHDREVAKHARRIIEIHDGNITSDTGPDLAAAHAPVLPASKPGHSSLAADMAEAGKMAIRALRTNLFRTILTLLGIMIGVASVVAMLAVGQGAQRDVLARIGSMGSNLLVVRPGAPNERVAAGSSVLTLIPEDGDAVAELPNVSAAVPERSGQVTLRIGNRDYLTQATATTVDMPETRNWPVERGAFFSRADQDGRATVAVIGQTAAKNLYDEADPVGSFLLINNVPFQIIGLMGPKGASQSGTDQDDVVFVPVTTGSMRLFGDPSVRTLTIAVTDTTRMDETQAAVTSVLKERHGKEDFQIRNMAALVETISSTQRTLSVLLASIAAISLLVGGIGIMNIMLMSVTERTREIGIRMATGAATRNILQQFMTEAVVVAAFGGTLGVVLGFASGAAIAMAGLPLQFTVLPVVVAFACAVMTGIVFGFMPALKAARLDPVAALASD